MSFNSDVMMNLFWLVISGGAFFTALQWPLKASLFPLVIGALVFLTSMADLLLSLFERQKKDAKQDSMDFKSAEGVNNDLAIRRTLSIFAWIIGFFLLILLFGFTIAVPVFVLLYLKLQGREGWRITLILAGSCWVFFWGLFVWLLDTPFPEGWVQKGLRAIGIG